MATYKEQITPVYALALIMAIIKAHRSRLLGRVDIVETSKLKVAATAE